VRWCECDADPKDVLCVHALVDFGHTNADLDTDSVRAKLLEDEHGKFGIERRQHLWRRFNHGDADPSAREVLRGLKTDETRADYDGVAGMPTHDLGERFRVLDGPK
jgi:hypothetical protein